MTTITAQWLKEKGACDREYDHFCQLFPAGVTVTRQALLEHGHLFDIDWVVFRLLKLDTIEEYANRLARYTELVAPAWLKYERESDAIANSYHSVYEDRPSPERDQLLADRDDRIARHLATYNKTAAILLADLLELP